MLGISTSEVLLAIIPFTEIVPEIQNECKSLAILLNDFYEDIEYVILLIGPIWVLILKRNRLYEITHSKSKYRGIRMVVVFFWAIVILFILDNIYELGCPIVREPGLYTIPPSPLNYLFSDMITALLYGGLITLFIFVLNRYFEKLFKIAKI